MSIATGQEKLENTLTSHYEDYFTAPGELEWYKLGAIDKADDVVAMCTEFPHDSILDIGAGCGAVLKRLEEGGFGTRLYAVDISQSGLDAMRRDDWNRLVECQAFDGYHIPYADEAFDLAILSHVIEHVEHPRALLAEAARVARHVYVEVPLELCALNRRLRHDFVLDSTGHINFYNPDLIRLLVQSSGLRVIKQRTTHVRREVYTHMRGRRGLVNFWIKELSLRSAPKLATRVFNYHCGLVCEAVR
jgi:SAM-dependent methyltransferase